MHTPNATATAHHAAVPHTQVAPSQQEAQPLGTSVRLDSLPRGVVARVAALTQDSDTPQAHKLRMRLLEIGFLPGEQVHILSRGFTGDPLAVRVGQATFALRRHEAAMVQVHHLEQH